VPLPPLVIEGSPRRQRKPVPALLI